MNYTIDTHSAVKILEEASFNEKQAEAIVSVVMKVCFANSEKALATKEFVRNEIQSLRNEVQTVRVDLESVRTEIQSTKAEIQSVRTEIQSVRTEIQSTKAETLKWMFGMFFVFSSAQLGILMIILKSFFKGVGGV